MNPEAMIKHLGMKIANLEIEDSRKQTVIDGLVIELNELRKQIEDGEAEKSQRWVGSEGREAASSSAEHATPPSEHESQEVSGDYFPGKAN